MERKKKSIFGGEEEKIELKEEEKKLNDCVIYLFEMENQVFEGKQCQMKLQGSISDLGSNKYFHLIFQEV
jgi:hypothetical protein